MIWPKKNLHHNICGKQKNIHQHGFGQKQKIPLSMRSKSSIPLNILISGGSRRVFAGGGRTWWKGADPYCRGGGETPILGPFLDVFLPFLIIFSTLPGGRPPL